MTQSGGGGPLGIVELELFPSTSSYKIMWKYVLRVRPPGAPFSPFPVHARATGKSFGRGITRKGIIKARSKLTGLELSGGGGGVRVSLLALIGFLQEKNASGKNCQRVSFSLA